MGIYFNCYFDVELQEKIKKGGTLKDAKVSVAGAWLDIYDKGTAYEEYELYEMDMDLRQSMQIVGYNSLNIDIPILSNYFDVKPFKRKHFDIYKYLVNKTKDIKIKLADVADGTLENEHKYNLTMTPYQAWEMQRIDELKKYVLQDVRLTKLVWEYGHENGFVYYITKKGEKKKVDVKW